MAISDLAQGIVQYRQGTQGLKNLAKIQAPSYSVSPEMQDAYNLSKSNASVGYSPEETANFNQSLARSGNANVQRGTDMAGGSMAGALNAGQQFTNVGAINNFAAGDASERNQHAGAFYGQAGAMQGQKNLMNEQAIKERLMKEQAYGMAVQAGMKNFNTGSNKIGGFFKSYFTGQKSKEGDYAGQGNGTGQGDGVATPQSAQQTGNGTTNGYNYGSDSSGASSIGAYN